MDLVLLLAAVGVVALVNAADSAVTSARAGAAGDATGMSHYELAYLAGGARRTINTALAILARAGVVRVSRGAAITHVQGAHPSPVPLEQAILELLAARPGGYVAGDLRRALDGHPALAQLEAALRARGLITDERMAAAVDRAMGRLKAATAGAMVFVLLALALAMFGVAGKEFPFVGALMFGGFGALTGFLALSKQKRLQRSQLSGEGRKVVRLARNAYPRGGIQPSSLSMAVGLPVALYGLTALDDRELCDELSTGDPSGDVSGSCGSSDSGFSDFGSSSDSSGSSCGGGSSCGSSSSSCSSSSS